MDLHLVTFDSTGRGRQADLDGGFFEYPADAFTHGTLRGTPINCLSRQQQELFHRGYDLRSVDRHDLRLLTELPIDGPGSTIGRCGRSTL